MDVTMRQAPALPSVTSIPGRMPIHQFAYFRSYPAAGAKGVVRFNFGAIAA